MELSIVCWDTHTQAPRVFKSPRTTKEAATVWLQSHLVEMFMAEGMAEDFAVDRALDFDVICMFPGDPL